MPILIVHPVASTTNFKTILMNYDLRNVARVVTPFGRVIMMFTTRYDSMAAEKTTK